MNSTVLHDASVLVWKVGVPITITSGTFGNIMVLLVQRRITDSSSSSLSLYFMWLAVSDLLALWSDQICWFLAACDAFIDYEVVCKLRVFLGYFTGQSSPAILVAMTFQRAASIWWPLKVGVYCNEKFARVVMVSIIVFIVLLNSHLLYGHSLQNQSGNETAKCFFSYVSPEYGDFMNLVYGWVDTTFCSILPFFLLFAANSALIWKVRTSLRETKQNLASGHSSQIQARHKKSSSMTVTLIVISIAFIVLTLPLSMYFVYARTFSQGADDDPTIAAANELALASTSVLFFFNYAINFYIYCLTGNKYRTECAKLFCLHSDSKSS
ncbi:probable G-protein coupled receptor 139 [Pomacea canaliculata]|uniref:probable G-protein coupled receptor 139 n=1 Tax=Pomacea canaliculata TaxID=400727 RepID=UPI000D7274AC|nr:probable G-protein coupled receptor 139 [Pomacea canaliculata]